MRVRMSAWSSTSLQRMARLIWASLRFSTKHQYVAWVQNQALTSSDGIPKVVIPYDFERIRAFLS